MKRFVVLFSALLATTAIAPAGAMGDDKQLFDFREARWGMSKEEIKANEDGSLRYEGDSRLLFQDKIMDKNFMIEYVIAQNKLYQAFFRLAEDYVMENEYIRDYFAFKGVLTGKYGDPVKERVIWNKSHLRDDQSQWGVAVSVGDLAYFTAWETDTTAITAILRGSDFTVDCTIEYLSKELAHLATQPAEAGPAKNPATERQRELSKDEKAF